MLEGSRFIAPSLEALAAGLGVVLVADAVAVQSRVSHPAALPDNDLQVLSWKYCHNKGTLLLTSIVQSHQGINIPASACAVKMIKPGCLNPLTGNGKWTPTHKVYRVSQTFRNFVIVVSNYSNSFQPFRDF